MNRPDIDDLVVVLDEIGQRPAPAPDPAFVARLEATLLAGSTAVPLTTHRRRGARGARSVIPASLLAVALAAGTAAAAVGGVALLDDSRQRVSTVPTDAPTTTESATTTGPVSTTSPSVDDQSPVTTGPPTVPPPVPVTPPQAAAATPAPTTVRSEPSTLPAVTPSEATSTTIAPTVPTVAVTAPAASTSRVDTAIPVAMTISCTTSVVGTTAVTCSWSASGSAEVSSYRILRSVDGDPKGRVFFPTGLTYRDELVTSGVAYRYMVQSVRADGTTVDRSDPVTISWG